MVFFNQNIIISKIKNIRIQFLIDKKQWSQIQNTKWDLLFLKFLFLFFTKNKLEDVPFFFFQTQSCFVFFFQKNEILKNKIRKLLKI